MVWLVNKEGPWVFFPHSPPPHTPKAPPLPPVLLLVLVGVVIFLVFPEPRDPVAQGAGGPSSLPPPPPRASVRRGIESRVDPGDRLRVVIACCFALSLRISYPFVGTPFYIFLRAPSLIFCETPHGIRIPN